MNQSPVPYNPNSDVRPSQYPYMSDGGGGAPVGIFVGAGVGACALIVGVVALAIYCYMKARKEKANTNMTKSTDVFSTAASNTQFDYPKRSKVNQFPDPEAARRSRRRERGLDSGHSNPAYARHSSDTSSISDADGRDLSPPRVRRPRGGQLNDAFSSESSYEDSSSVDDEVEGGNYRMERETDRERDRKSRSSYKRATGRQDELDSRNTGGRYRRTDDESQRMSRRDDFPKRNPRSDSPLTIETLEKHEKNLARRDSKEWDDQKAFKNKSRKRDSSPSRTYESSEVTQASLTTAGTDFTGTTSSTRFQKNPSLRRNSPSRSSSHRRYKNTEKDEQGRRKPRRTRSKDRQSSSDRHNDRSRSPGSAASSRSGSGSTRRSRSSSQREAKRINKDQAMLPIFADMKKKSSAV